MKKLIIIVSVIFFNLTLVTNASWYDTGWKTFTQPNGVKFTARMYGDEYENYFITEESYSVIKNYSDGYYYYASNSINGRFIFSNMKVGIDKPTGLPKGLSRKNPFLSNPQQEERLNKDGNVYLAETTSTTYTLKVLLVEFADIHGRNYYTRSNFENMLDAANYSSSPDGEVTYGSMNQYYNCMTNGDVIVDATVLNNTSGGDLPIWVRLGYNKADYENNSRSFFTDAYNAGVSAGYNLSTSSTTKLVYIYAGNYYGGNLNPMASGNSYIMSEVWGGRTHYGDENTAANGYTFAHIGIHCHEFGHLLGLSDIYFWRHSIDWSLMGDGCDMGGTDPKKGQCPAPIDPHQRYTHNWITVQTPSIPNNGLSFTYDGANPTIYRIVSGTEVYYFENRRYQDYGRFCPGYDSYPTSGGIIVWRTDGASSWPRVELIEADGEQDLTGNYGDLWPGSSVNRNLNDFTEVSSQKYNGTNSNIIMHSVSDPGTSMTAILGGKWFGNLPSSLTFSGPVLVGATLQIPSGLTLNVSPGSTFQFSSGVSLNVSGILNATGTSSDNIVFTREGSSGNWSGIAFNYNASGSIDYCNMSYAQTALSLYGIQPIQISNSSFHDNSQNGIFLNMSSPSINNNQIRNNGYYGIWAQNESNPSISNNIITGNSYSGIYSDLYSFISTSQAYPLGSNAIRNNSIGISFNYNSEAYFGGPGGGGSNSICTNTGYEISAISNSYVIVQNNWWGNYPPQASEFYADGSSSIDRSNPLDYDPNPTMLKSMPIVFNNSESNNQEQSYFESNLFYDDELMDALKAFYFGNFTEALLKYKELFKKATNINKKKYILAKISQCSMKLGNNEINDFIDVNIRAKYSTKDEIYAVALELESLAFMGDGKIQNAVENLYYLKDNFSAYDEIYKHTLFNLSLIYGKYFNDIPKAKNYLDELEEKFPDDQLLRNGKVLILGVDVNDIPNQDQLKSAESQTSNTNDFTLFAYPNPFNPCTKIRFSIPEKSPISIKIYDILGKEVRILTNKVYEAGKYEVEFDASGLPSGVYISCLFDGKNSLTQKILLIK